MAEQQSSSAIVPATKPTIEGEYMLSVREFEPGGTKALNISVPAPTTSDFAKWSLMQQAVMLKKGAWSKSPLNEIFFGLAYAHSLGLDVMRGDIFPTGEGRLGIANKAKIKLALATGNIEGIEVEMRDTGEKVDLTGCVQKTDLECSVTVHVKGWKVPIRRKARLSRWFKAKNPNWQGNPEHMLELNTLAHALEYVNPTATEDDEAPPLTLALDTTTPAVAALNKALETVSNEASKPSEITKEK